MEIKSFTGEYLFEKRKKGEYVFQRTHDQNRQYIAKCAALAFHKALFGVSELKALESVANVESAGGLRISRSISTYYIIYHLFTFLMLLDEEYEIVLKYFENRINEYIPFEVDEEELNSSDESPEQWKKQKILEKDLAIDISHSKISGYCEEMRTSSVEETDLRYILYKHFVSRDCETILFEKVCYIRDRMVYRPSVVINLGGQPIQTSAEVRKEFNSLPSWNKLYSIIIEFYDAIIEFFKKNNQDYLSELMNEIWKYPLRENREHLLSLGWSNEDIQDLDILKGERNILLFDTHISHMMETSDILRLKHDCEILWNPLKRIWDTQTFRN